MKSRTLYLIILLVLFSFPAWFMPVQASTEETMKDTSPTEYEGTWSTKNNYARETLEGSVYRINIVFEFYIVPQDADDYWFHIDYNYISPGWPWVESLDVMYRWGTSGGFTHLVYYDVLASEGNWDITSPSSTTLQLKFRGCAEVADGMQTTWYFGDEPILHMYWE